MTDQPATRHPLLDDLAHVSAADGFGYLRGFLARLRQHPDPVRIVQLRRLGPTLAFSRRDELHDGFDEASRRARALGFAPAVRLVGGTFAPLHEGSLVLDEYGTGAATILSPDELFTAHTRLVASVLRQAGADAALGPVAHEYCPGIHSVNARGAVKLAGTAARQSAGAWVVSSVIQVGRAAPLREVTATVADALDYDVDPDTVGSLSDELDRDIDPVVIADALVDAYRAEEGRVPLFLRML